MTRPIGVCPKCRVKRHMTKHHVYPVRFFGRKGNNTCFLLCWNCHRDLERMIPQSLKKSKNWYVKVLLDFLQDTKPFD